MTYLRPCFAHLPDIERKRIAPTPRSDFRLHRLERSEPLHPALEWAIREALEDYNLYPDYAPFYERLARFASVDPAQLVVGAGIEDFIRSLILLTCEPGQRFAFTWPTCAMFDVYAEAFGVKPHRIIPEPDAPFTVEDIAAQLPLDTRLLILPNPGQPVETCFGTDDLRRLARHCHAIGTVLAIDEAYHGFGAPTALDLVREFDNVVVLRTFSKAMGAAGIRVGYAVSQRILTGALHAIRESGEIAGPSLQIATVLMDRWDDLVRPEVEQVCRGRDWFRDRLMADGIPARGRVANHVLVTLRDADHAAAVVQRLKARRVHVRGGYAAPLDRHILVTAASQGVMEHIYDHFTAAL